MGNKIQIRRGVHANLPALDAGELGLETDTGNVYIGNTGNVLLGGTGSTHVAVTLDANADTLLSLSTQALGLDTKAANLVFAGPTTGAAAVPTFRSLVSADIPALAYEASGAIATHTALITGVHGLVFTAGKTLTLTEALTLNALPIGGLAVATAANVLGSLAVGATTQVLVGGGAGTVPAWAADLPTAVTIGSAYIYRASGTDVPVADGGTGVSTLALNGVVFGNAASAVGVTAAATAQYQVLTAGATPFVPAWSGVELTGASGKRLTLTNSLTNQGGNDGILSWSGAYTLTVPATGTAALLGTAQAFSQINAFTLGLSAGVVGTPASMLQVAETITTSPRGIMSSQHSTGVDGARFHLRKSRGSNASPTVVATGDILGRLVASGYDGTNYLEMGGIDIVAAGTIATGRVPTEMRFLTATDAATSVLTQRMVIDKSGNVGIGTTGPVNKLTVSGDANITGWLGIGVTAGSVANKFEVKGSNTSGLDYISTVINSAGEHLATVFDEDNNFWKFRASGTVRDIAFNMAATEVMRLTTTGNVGIGTTFVGAGVTYQKLNVAGAVLLVGASSTQEREIATFVPSFVVSTDASRTARIVGNVYDAAGAREWIRGEASGTAAMVGFLGAGAIARPGALAAALTILTHSAPGTPDYALADPSLAGYGFTTADEFLTAMSVIANLQAWRNSIDDILGHTAGYGLLTH